MADEKEKLDEELGQEPLKEDKEGADGAQAAGDGAQAAEGQDGAGQEKDGAGAGTEDTPGAGGELPAAVKEKIDALEDRVRRQMAEFDNYRKRTEREKEQRFSMGERSVIEKILPVVDNFERGLQANPEQDKGSALASGMEMIYKQLVKQLEDLGVKPIEAVGHEFDPNFHNAVMQVESEDLDTGIVAQEFQKGYLYHDSVLRHSMVGVAK